MTQREKRLELMEALAKKIDKPYDEIMYCKGGFFVKNGGSYSLTQAYRLTGVKPPERKPREVMLPWGDYAAIALFNGIKIKE